MTDRAQRYGVAQPLPEPPIDAFANADPEAMPRDRWGLPIEPPWDRDVPVPGRRSLRKLWPDERVKAYADFEARVFTEKRSLTATARSVHVRHDLAARVVSLPASWFEHLKMTLSTRWPRLFGWLTVRWRRA